MDKKRNTLITGATGFLGSYILKSLLREKNVTPIVLARGKKGRKATDRVEDTLKYLYGAGAHKKFLKRIKVVEGGIESGTLGIDSETRKALAGDIDEIYHSAAIAEFRIPLEIIRKVNTEGARHIFDFAVECKKTGKFEKVNHISTTFVAGTKIGILHEDELDMGQGFNNTYEQTKFEAELLAHEYMGKGLPISIFRPSIITGDYESGRTSNFKMLYQPLRFFVKELFDAIPADRSTRFNMIPVDFVADTICSIAKEKKAIGDTFHIANTDTVTAGHFIDLAGDFFGFKKPEFVPMDNFDISTLTAVQKKLIEPYIPYFNYKTMFDAKRMGKILKVEGLTIPVVDDSFLVKLFEFCDKVGFIKRNRQYVAT